MRVSSISALAALHLMRDRVELEVGEVQGLAAGARAGAAQQRAQAREQLVEREGLHDVVVGAGVEPGHAVGHGVARGQHQHRGAVAHRPHPAADLEAVDVRHHHVEHDRVGLVAATWRASASAPSAARLDLVALQPQRPLERVPHRGLVVDHEDLHALQCDAPS